MDTSCTPGTCLKNEAEIVAVQVVTGVDTQPRVQRRLRRRGKTRQLRILAAEIPEAAA